MVLMLITYLQFTIPPYYTMRLESHCALTRQYVDLVVSIKVAVEVCCCCVTFHCVQLLNNS